MVFSTLRQAWSNLGNSATLAWALPAILGGFVTGCICLIGVWLMSKKLHRMRVLDHVRRELKGPVIEYIDWLHTIAGEFPNWRRDLISGFRPQSAQDQFELNRMRKLFVDPRSTLWFARLEEYESLLGKFSRVIQGIWLRQAEIGECFHRILSGIESNTALANQAANKIEKLAFEQAQLASDFIDHLQYECLKSVMGRPPKRTATAPTAKIVRTLLGSLRIDEPILKI
jgi:hypothetical protein